MHIYKITNKINQKWYIGQHNGKNPNYLGSGKLLKKAIKKYGKENFDKVILEECFTKEELDIREKWWIAESNALNDPMSYNLVDGGEGGDRSQFINYDNMNRSNLTCSGSSAWFKSLSTEAKDAFHQRQGMIRSKLWYISRVNDPIEKPIKNIAAWCRKHGIDTAVPSKMNTPGSERYQKQVKGWRIRREDSQQWPSYINKRKISGRVHVFCKGRTWKLINGQRVWMDK
jgi:hypothetical protein